MATSTTNYSFTLPEVGGDTDQWGTQLNANWTSLDSTLKTVADSVGDDVTLTGNDFLTISGQAITVGDVDLTADVTGTLPVASGGTGLAALGSANQVLAVNATADGLEFQTVSGSGTVTSVSVSGSDGIEVDSGSPITSSGTIALGINATSLSTHLGLGSLATQSTITESQISDLQSYLTAESNDLSSVVTWANVPDINITESSVTQHQAALSITESQISDLQSYLTAESNDLSAAVTWANVPDANITQSSVTQHQSALSITESQISDFGSYQTSDAGLTSIAGLTTAADKMLYTTASDVYAVTALTTAGRALLDDADSTAQRTTLGLGALATQDTITESQISDLGSYITASSTDTLTNKSGDISQWTNDAGYLTAETNDLSNVSGTLGTGNGGTGLSAIGTANQVLAVNTGATGLEFQTISITESQISDLQTYLTAETNDLSAAVTWANVPDVNITQSSVTQHQAALSITESQISDLGSYQPSDAGLTSIAALTTAADKMIYTTASDTYAVATLTSAGRALLDDADAAAQRTTLGLGTAATTATTDYATSAQGATADTALQNVVDDTTPQLGGNLDVNGNSIVSVSAGNISITPDTAGKIILDGLSWPTADGSADQVLQTDGAGNLSFVDQSGGGGITTGKAIAMAIVFG